MATDKQYFSSDPDFSDDLSDEDTAMSDPNYKNSREAYMLRLKKRKNKGGKSPR